MKKKNFNRKVLGILLFIGLAVLSFYAVTQQSESFSFENFWQSVLEANPVMLALAFCGTIMFVVFEGFALRATVLEFGQKCSVRKSIVYSATDIYFSAITPSAIGGQPACAYIMMKDQISGSVCAIALLCMLMMYSVAILVVGILLVLLCPHVLSMFSGASMVLLVIGTIAQVLLVLLFYLLLWHSTFLHNIGTLGLKLLKKCHLIRNYEAKQSKLDASIAKYKEECSYLLKRPKLLVKMFFFNMGQRLSWMLVPVFCFLGFTGDFRKILDVIAIQCLATVGSNCVPLPGAMGVYDLLLLDGLSGIMEEQQAVNLELVSRMVSFYSCLIFCGIIVLIVYLRLMIQDRHANREE